MRLRDKSQVVNLSTTGFDSPSKCLLLQRFSKLHRLCLRDHIDTPTSEPLDFETIFENTPLEYLQINVSNIQSLPRTIQELRVGCDRVGKTLTQKTWQAVSRLRHLKDLAATHERLETWLPFAFKSANLQSVTLSFTWEPADRFDQQILEPMLASSKSLRSVAISPQLLSASTLKLFSKSDSAQSITVIKISSHYTKFNFEDLVVSLRNLPRLETLTLPWPIMFSPYPSGVRTDSASPAPESASADFDQPHVLHFSHCEAIPVSCPNLTEIHLNQMCPPKKMTTIFSGKQKKRKLMRTKTMTYRLSIPRISTLRTIRISGFVSSVASHSKTADWSRLRTLLVSMCVLYFLIPVMQASTTQYDCLFY